MRWLSALWTSLAIAMAPVTAIAKDGDTVRMAPFLPQLSLSGSTEGDAKFKGGADFIFRIGPDHDVSVAPMFEVATNEGLTRLFSTTRADTAESMPWRAGGSVTLFYLGDAVPRTAVPAFRSADIRAKEGVFATCEKVCKDNPEGPGCDRFKKARAAAYDVAQSISPEKYCDAGRDQWVKYEGRIEREQRGIYPVLMSSLGFVWGRDSFSYVSADPSASVMTVKKDERHSAYRAAASLVWITRAPIVAGTTLTLETSFLAESKYVAQTTNAEWCTPAGSVARKEGTATDDARTCQKKTLNGPDHTPTESAAALIGLVNRFQDTWRFALGPRLVRSGDSWALGIESPLYFNLLSAPAEYAGSYKGILRLVPSMQWSLAGDEFPTRRFFVTLELLGQRTLFPTALN